MRKEQVDMRDRSRLLCALGSEHISSPGSPGLGLPGYPNSSSRRTAGISAGVCRQEWRDGWLAASPAE